MVVRRWARERTAGSRFSGRSAALAELSGAAPSAGTSCPPSHARGCPQHDAAQAAKAEKGGRHARRPGSTTMTTPSTHWTCAISDGNPAADDDVAIAKEVRPSTMKRRLSKCHQTVESRTDSQTNFTVEEAGPTEIEKPEPHLSQWSMCVQIAVGIMGASVDAAVMGLIFLINARASKTNSEPLLWDHQGFVKKTSSPTAGVTVGTASCRPAQALPSCRRCPRNHRQACRRFSRRRLRHRAHQRRRDRHRHHRRRTVADSRGTTDRNCWDGSARMIWMA